MSLTISAVLSLTSPLHIASPEDARVDPKTGMISGGNAKTGTPCTRTQRHEILLQQQQQEEEGRSSRFVPIVPANSIRGRIRRQAAAIIKEHLLKRNEKLTLDAYHTLMAGSPNGYPDSALPSVDEFNQAAQHPFFGIFGGGPRMLPSRLKVDTAYPINEATIDTGIVPSMLESFSTNLWNTQAVTFRRVDDALTLTDNQIFDIVDDVVEAVEEWRELTASQGNLEDEEQSNAKFQGIRSWTSHEIIKPGTTFHFNMSLNSFDEAQRGLMLRAAEGFFNLQNLGGWSRNGYGRYSVLDAKISSIVEGQVVSGQLLKKTASGNYVLDRDNDDIDSYLLALDEALENVTAADIENYATFVSNKVEEKKKKALAVRAEQAAKKSAKKK